MAVRAVKVLLNDGEHELRLDMEAMAALEDKGYDLEELVDFLRSGKLSAKRIRVLLWAMTQHEDNPPTLKQVGRSVDGENFEMVLANVGEALKLAFPQKPKEGASPPPNGAGTGAKSSALLTVHSP